ncbi:MAG: circularly permuted type 2 ATP-grasp protein [Rubrivivax sp.]|nr:circularly permuted type 2 ATP-grasp protein [Rubrivivax sp.]
MPPSQGQTQASLPFGPAQQQGEAALDLLLRRALPAEPGVWDELRGAGAAGSTLRPAWQRLARWLTPPAGGSSQLADDLDRRGLQVTQQLRHDGVTHNVFDDSGVASRPWSLQLLPQLIEPGDWALIERGVVQRAALLERVLDDLYGAQTLLQRGLLPPALLLRHPGYLRAMQGVQPPGGQRLHIVAFDLARDPAGRWTVLAQRTQGPSGLGYVLHNRLTISRQFPDAFRELRVQHIASSYRRLLDTVDALAREVAGGQTPRVVLLTPGRFSETYFEHAYLARYLGLPLVEGGDLTVRNQRLWLRTVDGLEPVHGVLRRLDDDWCDPLELRADSALGVPGLLQAARAGTVVMANALGSAFLESPALHGFLPGISQALLDQPLAMPSVPSWWCGEAAAWADVRKRLDGKLLRTTFPVAGRTSRIEPATVDDVGRDPDAWTAQDRFRLGRAPIWSAGVLGPRPALVRVYVIADDQGRWHVLPGGMTRVARSEDASVSMQRGGTSLDTWVLTDGPVDTFSMLPQRLSVDDLGAYRRPVSSRTGENLFWLGRYTERTEQQVRLARATLMLIDADSDSADAVLLALSQLAVKTSLAPPGVPTLLQSPPVFVRALLDALVDAAGSCSVAYHLAALERASQALRERLSTEQWGLIRSMDETFVAALQAPGPESTPAASLPAVPDVVRALDVLALQLAAVTGAQTDRMTRDHGWRLLTVGRLLERLYGLSTIMQSFVDAGALHSAGGIDRLLDLFDSAITFRARYQRHEDLLALTELLVLDDSNPRAFAGVLRRLRTELKKLPGEPPQLAELLALLPAEGAGLTLQALRDADDARIESELLTVSLRLGAAALQLAEEIGLRYFTLAQGHDHAV